MRPIIGLTCSSENMVSKSINRLDYPYINAITESKGIPIIIPILKNYDHIERYLDIVDGIVFTGGEDLSPLLFNEEPIRKLGDVDMDRDLTEMYLFEKAYERGIPILGICRGAQLINIALGGSVYQDIYSQIDHVIGHSYPNNLQNGHHTISIEKDSLMFQIFNKEKLVVNSWHHQSINKLGRNLKITATTTDGIVEAIESTNEKFVLGLQWHPESMLVKDQEFLKPYTYFVSKC